MNTSPPPTPDTRALHERIRADMEQRIRTGDLAPGDRLPTEAALMQQYDCARMTVNKALSALATAGLIERRKRAGSFVARPPVQSMVLNVPDLMQEVASRGQAYRFQLLHRAIRPAHTGANAVDADERALAGDGLLLVVSGVHYADDRPLAVEHRLVSITAIPAIADADFTDLPPGSWLLRHIPWTEAETRISAVGASSEDAAALAIAANTPCLALERHTWRGDQAITAVRQIFTSDSYALIARFGPSSA